MQRLLRWYGPREGLVLGALGMLLLLVLWEVGGRLMRDVNLISLPSLVWDAADRQFATGQLLNDTRVTMQELGIGFGVAVLLGIPVGLLMGWYRLVEYTLDPYLWFFYTAPTVAFYPLMIFWLGLGQPTIIALTFLLSVFPVVANTLTGVQNVDASLVRAAKSFGASSTQIFGWVVLPAALPTVVAGLRLGVGRALVGAVLGEFFGANAGLGYRISFYGAKVRTTDLLVSVLVIMIVGTTLNQALRWLEGRLSTWRAQ